MNKSLLVLVALLSTAVACERNAPVDGESQSARAAAEATAAASATAAAAAATVSADTVASEAESKSSCGGSCGGQSCGGICGGGESAGGGSCGQYKEAAAQVTARGVPGDVKWTTFDVVGMRCGGCESKVIATVGKLDGVLGVEASAAKGTVRIAMSDTSKQVLSHARTQINTLGYRVLE